ncbi:MAG: anti-sigma factor antagonist [Planctomycetota bacterium]|nr:MAG: anti-sigma factor antagonist [Planctomycetota bacterium]
MSLPIEIFGDVVVVHAPDELSGDAADTLAGYLASLERNQVVFDLDGAELIASQGLEAILDAQDRLRELGGDVKIATANRYNRKILEMTRLDQQLEVFGSVIDAVKSYC